MTSTIDDLQGKFDQMVPFGGPEFSEIVRAMQHSFDSVEPANFKMPPQILEMANKMATEMPAMKLMQLSLVYILTGNKLPEKGLVDYMHRMLTERDLDLHLEGSPTEVCRKLADTMVSCLSFVLANFPEEMKAQVLHELSQFLMDRLSKLKL